MLRNLKIGSQIGLSFGLVLMIMAVVSLTACEPGARVSRSTAAWPGKASCPVVFRPIC